MSGLQRREPLRADPAKQRAWQQRSRGSLSRSGGKGLDRTGKGMPKRNRPKLTVGERVDRDMLAERSGGRCEAHTRDGRRCRRRASEAQHRITRARQGKLLDGRTLYHLAHLCHECHRIADNSTPGADAPLWAWIEGEFVPLLVDGALHTELDGRVVYVDGVDEGFRRRFGA